MPIDVEKMNIDLLSISAHKFYGPKGVGALFIDRSLELAPLLHGGGQEQGRRAGTENVASIAGLGLAAEQGFGCDADGIDLGLAELEMRTREAAFQKVTGVPNFMLGAWPFGGIQSDETMLSILGRYARKERERAGIG